MGGHEVADADGADLAVGEQGLQRAVGLDGEVEACGQGLVEQEEVDLVDAELAGALVEGVQSGVVAVVGDPGLGLDEDVGAVESGAADGFADLTLVAVGGGGVDEPVAGGQCGLDGGDRLVGRVWKTPGVGGLQCGLAGVLVQPRPSRSAAEATAANGAGSAALTAASSRVRWPPMAACRSAGSVVSSSSSIA
jgi:hypothetical protein